MTQGYILSSRGTPIYFNDPKPDQYSIEMIAKSLSRIPRFTGHCADAYSVAQHSVMVSKLVRDLGGDVEIQLQGLMHDAAEMVTNDVPSPVKKECSRLIEIENKNKAPIYEHFGLPTTEHELVKEADRIAIAIEVRNQWHCSTWHWFKLGFPIDSTRTDVKLIVQSEMTARARFLEHYEHLQRLRGVPPSH